MQTYMAWAVPILAVVVSLLVGYLKGYTKKRGENKAMHDDLGKLVDQVRAVTTTAKEIEAQISGGLWDKQRRWELRRDVIFDAMKRLGATDDALRNLDTVYRTARENGADEIYWVRARLDAKKKLFNVSTEFDESRSLISLVCADEVRAACDNVAVFMGTISVGITQNDAEIYSKSTKELWQKLIAAKTAMRKELEIGKAT